ncbi:hypothetical protein B296_00037406 [Ensete ventricosum]|uniref:Uncharacterized protein n=1 Tax=Ensete ventricosum TaxID=4639 RepID=A0A426XTA3_ENSVE|nr:hypothetical protein B296_00037406 [Ensete ventricosum]
MVPYPTSARGPSVDMAAAVVPARSNSPPMASLRCKRSGGCCQLDNCWTGVRMRSNCERVIVPSNGGGAGDVIGSDPSAPKSYQHLDYFRIGFRLRRSFRGRDEKRGAQVVYPIIYLICASALVFAWWWWGPPQGPAPR